MIVYGSEISRILYGSNEIGEVYYGSDKVFGGSQPSYVTDGLILWLDGIDKGPDNTAWVDKVSGAVFTNNGATFNTDCVSFDGTSSCYLSNTTFTTPTCSTGTIEVVYNSYALATNGILYMPKGSGQLLAFGFYGSKCIWGTGSKIKQFTGSKDGSVSISNARAYRNGASMSTSGSDYWSGSDSTTMYLGKRSSGTPCYKGDVYCIRIYNRQLTQAEVLANLAVDNTRFNLGLTL